MQRATSTLLSATRRIASSNFNVACSLSTRQSTPLLLKGHNTAPLAKTMVMALNASTCQQLRGYATKKDAKKGGKGGKGGKKGGDDDDEDDRKGKGKSSGGSAPSGEMSFDLLDLEKKMGQCLERLKKDFMTMRAGTANPGNKRLLFRGCDSTSDMHDSVERSGRI